MSSRAYLLIYKTLIWPRRSCPEACHSQHFFYNAASARKRRHRLRPHKHRDQLTCCCWGGFPQSVLGSIPIRQGHGLFHNLRDKIPVIVRFMRSIFRKEVGLFRAIATKVPVTRNLSTDRSLMSIQNHCNLASIFSVVHKREI